MASSSFIRHALKKYSGTSHLAWRHHDLVAARLSSSASSLNLKDVLADKIPVEQKRIGEFRKQHGSHVVGNVTIDQMYGGMRGIKSMVWETSHLDPELGIEFRKHTIPQCQDQLPKAPHGGDEPLPEGLFWLLLTDQIPSQEQVAGVTAEWNARAHVPEHVIQMILAFPKSLHPMSQFSAAITACQTESVFAKAYSDGVHKANYWEYIYEDAMNLIAKLPTLAAMIYRNLYTSEPLKQPVIDEKVDWSHNFTNMMGYKDNPLFTDMMRMYLCIHSDHEGGNVSAHTSHLVASALSDPYLSFAAAMNGLAGPLHGLANQEVLVWLMKLEEKFGKEISDEQLKKFLWETLESGQVVPGYGHAVLRATDPRYIVQRDFCLKHMPDYHLFKLVNQIYKFAPDILLAHGKAKNPWPNVDAHSGVLLQYFDVTQMQFYTVLFGVSRALGCLSQQVWSRALGLPLERPKSLTSDMLMDMVKAEGKTKGA